MMTGVERIALIVRLYLKRQCQRRVYVIIVMRMYLSVELTIAEAGDDPAARQAKKEINK